VAKNNLIAPVLKWVGGKRQLLDAIIALKPTRFRSYYEPFVGGGAVFFHLQPKKAIINDANAELINVYKVIRDSPKALIDDLMSHKNEVDYFYRIRGLDRLPNYPDLSDIKRASRLIYLNKTCYNGLYRVNSSGEFNTPFGRYKNPNFINEPTIKAVSRYLNTPTIQILNIDYEQALAEATRDDFVYLDPPYHPVSQTANFTGYVRGGWGEEDQVRLRNVCDDLNERGVKFLLSNSATAFIGGLYANYHIHTVKATRAVNSNAAKRGEIDEYLIRNYD